MRFKQLKFWNETAILSLQSGVSCFVFHEVAVFFVFEIGSLPITSAFESLMTTKHSITVCR